MATSTAHSGSVCKPGLPFQLPPGFQPSEFLYGAQGPWPSQPGGENACKVAPEVLMEGPHCIPQPEVDDWTKYLYNYLYYNFALNFVPSAIKYSANLLRVPVGWLYEAGIEAQILAWYELGSPVDFEDTKGAYPGLPDSTFTEMIAHGLLSKLMSELDAPDKSLLEDLLNDEAREYWKCDLTHMMVVRKTWPDEYVAPCIVLMSRPLGTSPGQEFDFRVDGIRIFAQSQAGGPYDRSALLKPGQGQAWQLAKYYALQAALVRVNLIDHPMVHFPCDAINAITKSVLPKSNRVLQLLLPHLFLSLPVDNRVLEGPHSLLSRTASFPYSPYPAAGEEIRKVFPFYWSGSVSETEPQESWASDRGVAFPPYQFPTQPRQIPSKYGSFLNGYFQPILNFTTGVVASIPDDGKSWEAIRFWADHVASWIPGFPDGNAIYKNNKLLAETCASIIWNCSIVHTADHWLMHQIFEQKLPTPYIMRNKPLLSATPGVEPDYRPEVWLIRDVIPARLCDEMFFMPHSTRLLSEFKYEFANQLGPVIEKFKLEMTTTDKKLHQQFPQFGISLYPQSGQDPTKNCFAAGVQF
jgi:hypothetical protein